MRLKEESRQARLREKRKEEAKNDIILQVRTSRVKDRLFYFVSSKGCLCVPQRRRLSR